MPKPHLVQCLWGPQRHCIVAMPYEPGVTSEQSPLDGRPMVLDERNAAGYTRHLVDSLIVQRKINPWCGICGARRDVWVFEDRPLAFDTLAEAMPVLEQSARDQAATKAIFDRSGRG